MKNIKQVSYARLALVLVALVAVVAASGCGSDEQPSTPAEKSAAREKYIRAVEHPDWATATEAKVNQACPTGTAGTSPINGRVMGVGNYGGSSRTIGVLVTCRDGSNRMVVVDMPTVD